MKNPAHLPHTARSFYPPRHADGTPISKLQRYCNANFAGFVLNSGDDDVEHASLVLNRAFRVEDDGWAQLAPYGLHPGTLHTPEGKKEKCLQRWDRETCDALVELFNRLKAEQGDDFAGLPVDREHYGETEDGDTAALAWIMQVQCRDDGLYGVLNYTGEGERLVKVGGVYKYVSIAADVARGEGDEVIPVRITGGGFTNKPNLRGIKPVVNREPGSPGAENKPAATKVAGTGDDMDWKSILLEILGLGDDATDEAISAAADAHVQNASDQKTELDGLKKKVEEAEKKQLETEADEFVKNHADRISDPAKAKEMYVRNKADTIAFFENVKPAGDTKAEGTVKNSGKTPKTGDAPSDSRQLQQKQTGAIGKIKNRDKCSNEQAYLTAKTEHPELFVQQ